jgi:Ca2+-binding RTX toxin-like protein
MVCAPASTLQEVTMRINGTIRPDVLHGTAAADEIFGFDGDDALYGGGGNDRLDGGNGKDWLQGGAGADFLDGGQGTDTASYLDSSAGVSVSLLTGRGLGGTAQGDVLVNIENLEGSHYNDALTGNDAANVLDGREGADLLNGRGGVDVLLGGDGNDWLGGGAGADVLDGGRDQDTASYADSASGVFVSLATGSGTGGTAEGDTLVNIENVDGSAHGDLLIGDDNANMLSGGGENDSLKGGGGADHLFGDQGNDRLDGGSNPVAGPDGEAFDSLMGGLGADTFVWSSISDTGTERASMDFIVDFHPEQGDKIDLHAIDANTMPGADGNQDFFRVVAGYSSTPGEIGYTSDGVDTFIHLNTDTDSAAEASIRIAGVLTPDASWFVF